MRTAKDLKIGDTFRRQGYKFTIHNILQDRYKNGTECVIVHCSKNDGKTVDSFFNFKLETKV